MIPMHDSDITALLLRPAAADPIRLSLQEKIEESGEPGKYHHIAEPLTAGQMRLVD